MNEAVAAAANDLAININERPATFFLRVSAPLGRHLPDAPASSRPAAAGGVRVRCGFASVAEAESSASDLGADWARDLRFVVPVSDPDFWNSVARRSW